MNTDMPLSLWIQILQTSNSGFFTKTGRNTWLVLNTAICSLTALRGVGTPLYAMLFTCILQFYLWFAYELIPVSSFLKDLILIISTAAAWCSRVKCSHLQICSLPSSDNYLVLKTGALNPASCLLQCTLANKLGVIKIEKAFLKILSETRTMFFLLLYS